MAIYRIHFTWQEKEYTLKAASLDMTHPYYVAIKDLILPEEKGYLINPADDDLRQRFAKVRQLLLPFQAVSLIEEYREDPDSPEPETTSPKAKVISTRSFKKS